MCGKGQYRIVLEHGQPLPEAFEEFFQKIYDNAVDLEIDIDGPDPRTQS